MSRYKYNYFFQKHFIVGIKKIVFLKAITRSRSFQRLGGVIWMFSKTMKIPFLSPSMSLETLN